MVGLLALWIGGQGGMIPVRAADPAPKRSPKELLEAALAVQVPQRTDFDRKFEPLQGPLTVPPSHPRDFNGMWMSGVVPGSALRTVEGTPLPINKVAFGFMAYYYFMDALGQTLGNSGIFCRLDGFLAGGGDAAGLRIIQTADYMVFLGRWNRRIVYLNRAHPKKLKPTYMGDGVGHWEGDVLVIDTIGFNDKTFLLEDRAAGVSPVVFPRSAQLHIVERLQKTKDGYEDLATIDDPVFFTHPFTIRRSYDWRSDLERPREYVCEENIRYKIVNGIVVDD
jgi:hypothetical protein